MLPRIIPPILSGRPLPLRNSIRDAAKLNIQECTTFYVSAYLFQAWLCELTLANSAQLAEKPNPKNRSFQTGQAWRGFLKYFGKASDAEFSEIFIHLGQFAEHDDPIAAYVLEAAAPLSIEHAITGEFLGDHTPSALLKDPKKLIALIRSTTTHLCDWLDSTCHYRVFHEWHIMPGCFDPDPKKRELAYLGISQSHFDSMSEHSQAHWLNHMSDVVEELKNSPKWSVFRQASSAPPPQPRPWPTQQLDRAIIKLWPLLKRHRWSAPDLLYVLRKVLRSDDLAPCPDETALAAYCSASLSLRHPGLKSRRRPEAEPPACNLALRLCSPEPADLPLAETTPPPR